MKRPRQAYMALHDPIRLLIGIASAVPFGSSYFVRRANSVEFELSVAVRGICEY